MENMAGTSCAFLGSSLLVYLAQSSSSLTLDPVASAPKASTGFLKCLSWLQSISEDIVFVSFSFSLAHSHDTPSILVHTQNSRLT